MAATILIVEDQPSIAELMELHLRAAGYAVAVAEDAIVAGRIILEARPDLLLVDVNLPFLSGYDFVATLMADQTIPHIPAIFITGDQSFGPRAAVLGAGVITKPCEAGELVALVGRMLTNVRTPALQADALLGRGETEAAA
jgi:DNA-binding response OmpR family regulator